MIMRNRKGSKTVKVLLIEDNPGDVRLIMEAFKERNLCNLSVVEDGEEAISFLHRQNLYENAPRPDIILLDINLPKKNGYEVLEEIKNEANLKTIPIIILTSSSSKRDIITCYALHANCYIIKPINVDDFINVVKFIEDFWFGIVELPQE